MDNAIKILNNEKQLRFETAGPEEPAYLEYRFYKGNLALMHTFVPDGREGQGIASALAAYAFAYAAEKKQLIMVYCPFVAAYLKRHPELKPQLNKTFHPG